MISCNKAAAKSFARCWIANACEKIAAVLNQAVLANAARIHPGLGCQRVQSALVQLPPNLHTSLFTGPADAGGLAYLPLGE
jgi:hypothetical protein